MGYGAKMGYKTVNTKKTYHVEGTNTKGKLPSTLPKNGETELTSQGDGLETCEV